MKKIKLSEISTLKGTTKVEALKSQSDDEIENVAKRSKDSRILSVLEVYELKRVQK